MVDTNGEGEAGIMALITQNQRIHAPKRTQDDPATAKSTRVLLVEDEPLTAEVFARALTRAGHVVDIAKDGLQALRNLRERTPSLVVLDMSLPTLSGSAVVREVRASGCVDVPIVVVSGSDQRQSSVTDELLSPGIWITKPIKPRNLVAIVADMIENGPPEN
ncbi:MAG: DNA-binding response OmpR family regulator [Planctomycetota bacterium]|jgi:DNA-binding response OmpR family regulator